MGELVVTVKRSQLNSSFKTKPLLVLLQFHMGAFPVEFELIVGFLDPFLSPCILRDEVKSRSLSKNLARTKALYVFDVY